MYICISASWGKVFMALDCLQMFQVPRLMFHDVGRYWYISLFVSFQSTPRIPTYVCMYLLIPSFSSILYIVLVQPLSVLD